MKLIAVCGQINSGKGVISDILIEEYGFVSMAFADPIKRIVQQMFCIPDDVLWGPSPKRQGKIRNMLQEFGTDFARKYDPEVWVDYTIKRIKHWKNYGEDICGLLPYVSYQPERKIVISDLRFPNEADGLCRNWTTQIFKVVRPDNFDTLDIPKENREHASETEVNEIPDNLITATIPNDKDLSHFHTAIQEVLCIHLK